MGKKIVAPDVVQELVIRKSKRKTRRGETRGKHQRKASIRKRVATQLDKDTFSNEEIQQLGGDHALERAIRLNHRFKHQ